MYFRRSWPSRFGACTFVRAEKRGGSEDNGGKIVPEIGRDFADQRQLLDPEFAHAGVERPLPLRLFDGIERRLVAARFCRGDVRDVRPGLFSAKTVLVAPLRQSATVA